jgi:hypothetical protein
MTYLEEHLPVWLVALAPLILQPLCHHFSIHLSILGQVEIGHNRMTTVLVMKTISRMASLHFYGLPFSSVLDEC